MIICPKIEVRDYKLKNHFYNKFLIQKDPVKNNSTNKITYSSDNSRYIDWFYTHCTDHYVKELVDNFHEELRMQNLKDFKIWIIPTELDADIESVASMSQEHKNNLAELAKWRLDQIGSKNYNWVTGFTYTAHLGLEENENYAKHLNKDFLTFKEALMTTPEPPDSLFIWSSFIRLSLGTIINLAEGKPALKYLFKLTK